MIVLVLQHIAVITASLSLGGLLGLLMYRLTTGRWK